MEFLQTVNVQATNDVEIGRKVRAIKRIAAEPIDEPAPPPDEAETDPAVNGNLDPTTPGPAYLVVGKGAAKPGEIATVEILGQTSREVNGFGAYIGCEPELELVGHSVPESLTAQIGVKNPEVVATQAKYGGTGDFLALMLLFFGRLTPEEKPVTGDEIEEEEERVYDVRIIGVQQRRFPELTPLMELRLRVPPTATAGRRFHLDNTSWKYGRRMSNGSGGTRTLRTRNEFGTSREVSRWGIEPVCISGWVDVL